MRLVGADEVEDDVGAAPARRSRRHRPLRAVDDLVGAELGRQPPAALVGVDRDHGARAELAHELERDVADPADADTTAVDPGTARCASRRTAW